MTSPDHLTARNSPPLTGVVRAPGDKSMSHRAFILGAMATGVTEIEGLLEGDDVLATGRAVEAFGATVERLGKGRWRVTGRRRVLGTGRRDRLRQCRDGRAAADGGGGGISSRGDV